MDNYWKYLPVSDKDREWGVCVRHVGHGSVAPYSVYPVGGHPAPYAFDWQQGRILDEYQLIYITQGQGMFESHATKKIDVEIGSIMLLFPGEWHRYTPDPNTGWYEYWVGFDGVTIEHIIAAGFFNRSRPVLKVGVQEEMIQVLEDIIEQTRFEYAGYQNRISGAVMYLLGMIQMTLKRQSLMDKSTDELLVHQAKALIRSHIATPISIENLSTQLNVSYPSLRKLFKKHTGISLKQYQIQLKIDRAKHLLVHSAMQIKEIAYALNFESVQHFSKQFKDKNGLSPKEYASQRQLWTEK